MEWVLPALAVLGPISGIVGAILGFSRNKRKDDAESGQRSGIVLTEIGYVKSGIDDIKRKQEKQDAQYVDLVTRLAKVEASSSQAHKRLDMFTGHKHDTD